MSWKRGKSRGGTVETGGSPPSRCLGLASWRCPPCDHHDGTLQPTAEDVPMSALATNFPDYARLPKKRQHIRWVLLLERVRCALGCWRVCAGSGSVRLTSEAFRCPCPSAVSIRCVASSRMRCRSVDDASAYFLKRSAKPFRASFSVAASVKVSPFFTHNWT